MALTKVSYSMINGEIYNVLDYGAVGDGATDCTTALQAAMDAMPINGGVLFFPAGNYLVSDQLVIPEADASYRKPIIFQGETSDLTDYSATKITYTKTSGALFQGRGSAGTDTRRFTGAIKNLTIIGPGSGNTADGVVVYDATGMLLESVSVMDFRYGFNPEHFFYYSNVNLCRFASCIYGIYSNVCAWNGTSVTNTRFASNTIHVYLKYPSSQINFIGCWFENATTYQVQLSNGFGAFFDQCYWEYNNGYAVYYNVDTSTAGNNCALTVQNSYIETDATDANAIFRVTASASTTTISTVLVNNLYSIASGSTVAYVGYTPYQLDAVYFIGQPQFRTATGWKAVANSNGTAWGSYGSVNFGNDVYWTSGAGSPETVVAAGIGSLYTRTDGGASTTLYVKESGTGATGWVAK
jgi:hypothetical protein